MYEYKAIVTKVYDGDTCTVDIDAGFNIWVRDVSIRIHHIDSPEVKSKNELESKAGKKVRDIVSNMILNKEIVIKTKKDAKEKFGRLLGVITIDNIILNDYLYNNNLVKAYEGAKKSDWTDEELNKIINYNK